MEAQPIFSYYISSVAKAEPHKARTLQIAIVGASVRGTSILERLCSSAEELLGPGITLEVHLIDPSPPGPGAVWVTTQSPCLLMNSVASQITMFTDESVDIVGPEHPGPNLYEWAFDKRIAMGPNDYPTRAQHGLYLKWAFEKAKHGAPSNIIVKVHPDTAVSLSDAHDNTQTLTLSSGKVLDGLSAVILAQGHLKQRPDTDQRNFISHASQNDLRYILPANPADTDLSSIAAGESVVLSGLGLCFFDYLALLTQDRGGTFTSTSDGLRYHASGQEPRLYAFSRRALPLHARANNAKATDVHHTPLVLTKDVIRRFRGRAGGQDAPDFQKEVWPLIALEVELVYYECILRQRDLDRPGFRLRFLATPYDRSQESQILGDFQIPLDCRWSWDLISRPYGERTFATAKDWTDWLLGYLREDVRQASLGNVECPLKAALDVMREIRNELREILDHDGLAGASRRDDVDGRYTPLNSFLSIGPPKQRVEEMIALMEAGVLCVLGPETNVQVNGRGWLAQSPKTPGLQAFATTLIEARVPKSNLRQTDDPLLTDLLRTRQCRPHTVGGYETGGLDVTRDAHRLVDAEGHAHDRRFAIGVPTEGVHWVTGAAARPGINSVLLRETDMVAREALKLVAWDATT